MLGSLKLLGFGGSKRIVGMLRRFVKMDCLKEGERGKEELSLENKD